MTDYTLIRDCFIRGDETCWSGAWRQGAGMVPPKAESDAADPSADLPRRGKSSAPAEICLGSLPAGRAP